MKVENLVVAAWLSEMSFVWSAEVKLKAETDSKRFFIYFKEMYKSISQPIQ